MATQHNLARVVHVSALGVSLKSESLYARTKAEGERNLLRQFSTATIIRPSVIFGPGDNFFNRFGQMAMMAPALPLIGGGVNKMQPVYVEDVAAAIVNALSMKETEGKIYQLGGPQIYSFKELMAFTLAATGRQRMLIPVPFAMMAVPALLAGLLPNPPITYDQLKLLKTDNVVQKNAAGFAELGIEPAAIEAVVGDYLTAFRAGGRFAA